MLYSVLIYDSEAVVGALPKEKLDTLIARHERVQEQLAAEGKLGPVVRLMPTMTATTLHRQAEHTITDGPFAETKEQLLGFYIVDCDSMEDAQDAARLIGSACDAHTLEVRPVSLYYPNEKPAPRRTTRPVAPIFPSD